MSRPLGLPGRAIGLVTPQPATSDTEGEILHTPPGILTRQPSQDIGDRQDEQLPVLTHRLRHSSSILAIVLSEHFIYAGTQAGEILVYGLRTFEKKAVIEGHRGSVLGLCLSADHELLFSSAGDRIVNIWRTKDYTRKCCLYSSYDVGDIFCIAYSSTLKTVYMGAQNTTIQWCSQEQKGTPACPRKPSVVSPDGEDPFFDSMGLGGVRTPRPADSNVLPRHAKGGEIVRIEKENIRHFAHYGYVYCMLLAKGIPGAGQNQEVLVTGGGDGFVKIWALDPKNGGAVSELFSLDDGREEGHSILTISLNDTFLYSGRSGGEVDVWDLETHQLVRNLKAHRDDVATVSVGGGFMFSAAITGYVRKFDGQYNLKSRVKAHDGRVLTSAFTYHRRRPVYVTGGNDNTLAIWDVSDCVTTPLMISKTSNEQLVDALAKFVSFRTVSSDPRYTVDCRRGASFLRSVFKNFGATTEMLNTHDVNGSKSFNPIILATFKGNPTTPGPRKKILFYGHYDVVPAENWTGKWIVDPFAMEGIDGYLYGRGTSDNKGPIMAAIFACAELRSEQALGSDIIFLIEGEEESGSRGFEKAIQDNKDKIGEVDWILVANSYWLDDRIPCLTYGLRGVIHAKVQVESSHPDMHSGVDGSSQLNESLKDLVMLLSTLTSKYGGVNIPGFYEPVLRLTEEEEQLYTDITTALIQRNPDLGDPKALATSLMQRWREASLTIHRFQTSGPENATIIPRLARAAISMRLVPNQEAGRVADALKGYLNAEFEKLESNNHLTITIDHMAEPWLGDLKNELFQTLEAAIMDVWGPIDQTRRRRSSAAPAAAPTSLSVRIPTKEMDGYFAAAKPSPTTSSVLANGSKEEPAVRPMSPLEEVNSKLENYSFEAQSKSPAGKQQQGEKRKSSVKRHGHSHSHSHSQSQNYQQQAQAQQKHLRKPLYIREGGSIPAIRFLEKEFDAPAAHLPCGQASDSAHLDNERLRLLNLYNAREVFKRVFWGLGAR